MDNKKKMKAMIKQMQSVIALVIIFVVASTICIKDGRNNFLDIRNLMNVLRAVSENGIIAIGMTIILILGDIDLSVGSVVGLISTGCAYLMVKSGLGFVPAVLVSLGIGALFGLFNGLCITKLRLQAFIVTLASMNIARGLARFWANGIGIPLAYGKGEGMAPPAFEVLQMRLWGIIPVPAIIFIVLLIVFQIILTLLCKSDCCCVIDFCNFIITLKRLHKLITKICKCIFCNIFLLHQEICSFTKCTGFGIYLIANKITCCINHLIIVRVRR